MVEVRFGLRTGSPRSPLEARSLDYPYVVARDESGQENVEVVKVAYEAFARGGLDRYMEHFTDDVVCWAVEGAPDEPIHGKDAVRAWVEDWIDMSTGSGWSRWN